MGGYTCFHFSIKNYSFDRHFRLTYVQIHKESYLCTIPLFLFDIYLLLCSIKYIEDWYVSTSLVEFKRYCLSRGSGTTHSFTRIITATIPQ